MFFFQDLILKNKTIYGVASKSVWWFCIWISLDRRPLKGKNN